MFSKIKAIGRRAATVAAGTVLVLSQCLGSFGAAFAPSTAYADTSTKTATVTLADTENGSLSFVGRDDDTKTITVNVGETVAIKASPADGYFADSLSVFNNSDNDASAVSLKDGIGTFKVTGSATVSTMFYENGSNGSSILKAVKVKEGKANKAIDEKTYIKENADSKYVGLGDKLEKKDVLTVTTTVVDSNILPNASLDNLWADDDGDGMSDHADALRANAVSHAILYDLNEDSDYYVGYAGSRISGATLADWGASENNADAKMRDGFVFDDATGLIYVPKKYTEKNKKGELKVASSRIQLLYATADKGAENSISVKISEDGVDGDVAENGTAKVDILATDTNIVLAKDKAARESLKDSSIDSVIANGIEYTRDMDMWSYDEGTGTLDLKLAPAGVRTVKVKLTNDTGKTVGNFLTSIATKAFAGNVNNIGTWKFNTAPYVGMTFHTAGHNKYTGTAAGGHTMPAVENPSGGRYEAKTIYQALGTQGVDVSALQSGNYSIERTCTINAQTTSSGVEIPNAANLNLTCGHVGVNPSGQLQNGYNQPKYTDDDYGQTVRVAAVYGNEAVVGVTVPTTFTQAGAGFFKVNWQLNKVNVTFSKISADAKVTNGNSEYSYAGAEFDIYRTRDNALVAHITMVGNGHASYQLDPNENYYAVETKAPQGFQKYEGHIDFSTGNSAGEQQFKDDPGVVKITVAKKDSATSGTAQTSLSLEGAEYKITSLSTPGWEATGKTNAKGILYFTAVPLGKVQIVETKAPAGYKLDTTVHTYTISAGEWLDATKVDGGAIELEPEDDFAENPQAFDVEIAKTKGGEDDSWESDNGHGKPAVGVQFQIISNSTGKVVGTLTTNESGFASTKDSDTCDETSISEDKTDDATRPWFGEGKRNAGIDGALPIDQKGYTIHEVDSTVPEGYDHVDDWTISADEEVNQSTKYYSVIDKTLTSRLQIVKCDAETGNTVLLSGFKFQILDADGKVVSFDDPYDVNAKVDTFTTDANGQVSMPGKLKSGKYAVKEIATSAPYLLNSETVGFEVSKDYKDASPITVVKVFDRQVMGQATITKSCADDGKNLKDAEYDVVAQENVVSPDGTVRASKGQIVDHVTTGDDGTATTKNLYLGSGSATYAFIETKAPKGHVLDTTPVEFTLSYKDDKTDLVTASVEQKDKPTKVKVNKTILGTDDVLAGAKFDIWNIDDQETFQTGTSVAIRADEGKEVSVKQNVSSSTVTVNSNDYSIVLKDKDGKEIEVGSDTTVEAGDYTVVAKKGDDEVKLSDATISVDKGKSYTVAIKNHIFGTSAELSETGDSVPSVKLTWDAARMAYTTDKALASGKYTVSVDGVAVGKISVKSGEIAYASISNDTVKCEPVLLKDGKKFTECTTDVKGEFDVKHLVAGSYRMVETEAPAGYIESPNVFAFTVDSDGMTEGVTEYTIDVTDDYTKLHVSKRDITNEAEIEGAKLTLKDSDGKVIDSWTSTTEDHVINALAPGKYTLTEERTPHTYDVAESIDFTVEKTGEIQTAVMYDKPISIKGEIDKRQEIADPTHPYTEANGDGENNADTSASDDGSYDYTLDFRSTSNTWTDEFTVEDDFYGVMTGKATLDSITTPQAYKDFDGKMNVWYKTDQTPSDYSDESGANQTLSDGHGNPWLTDESNSETLGEDGRKIDYTGWKLWKADVSTTEAEDLKVSDLELAEGEHVTAIRFEYGRVESGFTTREDDWDRDGIKDSHDDVNDATETAKGNGSYSDGVSILVDLDGSGKFTAFGNNGLGGKIKQKDGTYTCKDGDTVYSLTLNKDGSASAKMTDKDGKETKVDLAAGQFKISEGVSGDYAPAIVHMKVTDDYRDGDSLENYAKVDLYRNGGGEDQLEDHDDDKVKQTPKSDSAIIGTTLTGEDGKHTVKVGEKVELTDTVSYTNIEAGVEHTVTGTLMDKTTGTPLSDGDGNPLSSSVTFTPEEKDGTVEVKFTVDTTHLDGHDLVAFETLTTKETETDRETGEKTTVDKTVAEHKDIDDANQTVTVTSDKSSMAQTGRNILIGAAIAAAVATGAGGTYIYRKRHQIDDADDMME